MKQATRSTLVAITLCSTLVPSHAQEQKPQIVHDAEYYILDAQHGQTWAVEDKELDAKLAELKKKFGTAPNIIHVMWDDTAVGEVGIPAIQKVRGFETPNIN
jgi:arylsulfatase